MLEIESDIGPGILLIGADEHYRVMIIGHRIVNALWCCGSRGLNVVEEFVDLSFDYCRINITHDNYALKVGPVPSLVIVAQDLWLESAHNLH